MLETIMKDNAKSLADVMVREGKAGQGWAVRLALAPLLPAKVKKIDEPIDLPPPTSTQEATEKIAHLASLIASGGIDVDIAQVLIDALRSYIAGQAVAELERRAGEGYGTIERLQAELAGLMTRAKT
jgi:hypothetical protein